MDVVNAKRPQVTNTLLSPQDRKRTFFSKLNLRQGKSIIDCYLAFFKTLKHFYSVLVRYLFQQIKWGSWFVNPRNGMHNLCFITTPP